MTYVIRIICCTGGCPSQQAIEQFILDGEYFHAPPIFQPPIMDENGWTSFRIYYHPLKRPIIVSRNEDDALFYAERKELLNLVPLNHIRQAKQIIGLEIDQPHLTPEAWQMLDGLEVYLAKQFDGIIYAPDDGFYNERLEKLTDSKLKYFFMGYFGATWPETSGPTWKDVVHTFIRKNPPETVEQAASELQDLINRRLDETELRQVITRELGANIYPPGSGLTYQGWLESVLQMLKEKR